MDQRVVDVALRASALLGLSSSSCSCACEARRLPPTGEAQAGDREEGPARAPEPSAAIGCKLGLVAEMLEETLEADRAFVLHISRATHDGRDAEAGAAPAIMFDGEFEYPVELARFAFANLSESEPVYSVQDGRAALIGRGVEPELAKEVADEINAGSCIWRLCFAFGKPWALAAVHSKEIGVAGEGPNGGSEPFERYFVLRSGETEVTEEVLTPSSPAVLRRLASELSRAKLLRSMTQDIRSTLETRRVIEKTASLLRDAYGADAVEIMAVGTKTSVPKGARARGESDVHLEGGELCITDVAMSPEGAPDETAPALWPVFRGRVQALMNKRPFETVQILDVLKAQDWAGEEPRGPEGLAEDAIVQAAQKLGVRSLLWRTTSYAGKINGCFALRWREPGRAFKPSELVLFEDVCEAVGVALEHANLIQQAQQDARAKSDFLSVITHEMRTPMQAVIGITDLLLDMKPSIEQREYLSVIRSCGQALVDLVSEVLDSSAVERGNQLRIAVAPMDLRSCAEEVMDMMRAPSFNLNQFRAERRNELQEPLQVARGVAEQPRTPASGESTPNLYSSAPFCPPAPPSCTGAPRQMGARVPRFIVCDKSRIRQARIRNAPL
eukprot:tig00001155_g7320.t1